MNNLSYVSSNCQAIFFDCLTLLAPKNGAWDRFVKQSSDFSPYEITFLTLKFFSIFHQQYSKNRLTNRKLNKDNNDIIVVLSCQAIFKLKLTKNIKVSYFRDKKRQAIFFDCLTRLTNNLTPFKKEKR